MKRPCKYPGCPALVDAGYCPVHAANAPKPRAAYDGWRKTNARQRAVDDIRNSARWQKVRRLKLSQNPLCEDPFGEHTRKGTTETARQVHHICGLRERPELAFAMDNLMSVCPRCHARLEHPPTPGGG